MIEFRNLTRQPLPTGVFKKLYRRIFASRAKRFNLSVVFAGPSRMRALNRRYRGKDKTADVLSFLLDKRNGEIFLNVQMASLLFLFVHGCLHLLGYNHTKDADAVRMERKEQYILKNKLHVTKKSHRNRPRD